MIRYWLSIGLAVILSGCSLSPWSSDEDSDVLTFLPAEQLTAWDMTGKFSVSTLDETNSGSVRWISSNQIDRLDILSLTGSVVARITATPREATLLTDDGNFSAPTADELIAAVLKVDLPVSALRHWARGLESPSLLSSRVERDESGRIRDMVQSGWTLKFNGRVEIEFGANRYEIPRTMTATKDNLKIRWVNTEWQVRAQ